MPNYNPVQTRDVRTLSPRQRSGPKTHWGKLRSSVNRLKDYGNGYASPVKKRNANGYSLLTKLVVEAGCPLGGNCPYCEGKVPEDGCKLRYNLYVEAIKNNNIDMITKFNELLATTQMEFAIRLKQHHDAKQPWDKETLTLARLLKDIMSDAHKAKHGTKIQLKHEVSYADIRDKMFQAGEKYEEELVTSEDGQVIAKVTKKTKKKYAESTEQETQQD